jgi:hypothetical protein
MKLPHVFLILVVSATVVFARVMAPYLDAEPPSVSLPAGYELAVKALGSSTNQFHCIRAIVFGRGFTDATAGPGWSFTFCTTNTPPKYKWVAVGFDGKTDVKDEHSVRLPE